MMAERSSVERGKVYQTPEGQWRWQAIGRNNEIVAYGGEPFDSKANARRAFEAVFPGVPFVVDLSDPADG